MHPVRIGLKLSQPGHGRRRAPRRLAGGRRGRLRPPLELRPLRRDHRRPRARRASRAGRCSARWPRPRAASASAAWSRATPTATRRCSPRWQSRVDHLSGGRLELGIGAAWAEIEHEMLGIEFGTAGRRVEWLDEACQLMKLLFTRSARRSRARATRCATRSRIRSRCRGRIRRSGSAVAASARHCGWSPSTPTSGTRRAASRTRSRACPACSTVTAPTSAATPPRSAARCRCATRGRRRLLAQRRRVRRAQRARADRDRFARPGACARRGRRALLPRCASSATPRRTASPTRDACPPHADAGLGDNRAKRPTPSPADRHVSRTS